jgi:hypothetical protein
MSATQVQRPVEPRAAEPAEAVVDRGGTIALWALLGVIGLVIVVQALLRWVLDSSQFSAAPLNTADHYAQWRWVSLRGVEVISAIVFFWLANLTIVRPLRRNGRLGIDGKIFIACLIGAVVDGMLNIIQYLFAWNAHSINLGSWSKFLPLHSSHANPRYAEALLWGIPMYIYFCIGVAIAGCLIVQALRKRSPRISNMSALAVVWVAAFIFDFVVENGIIRLTQAYSFAKTPHALTLWPGSLYQFPIYESVSVATLGVLFTALRLSAVDSPDGVSIVERGYHRFPAALQEPLRVIAVIGFALTVLFMIYHLPFNWLGVTGSSTAHLPSYMRP